MNHLFLPAADRHALARFYAERFGFRAATLEEMPDGTLFIRNDHAFDLAFGDGPPHFGLVARTPAEVEAATAGLDVLEDVTEDGFRSVKARDPAGHIVEVYWEEPRISVQDVGLGERAWLEELMGGFSGTRQARRGEALDALDFPMLLAERDGRPVGALVYRDEGDRYEIFYMEAVEHRRGTGTALVRALQARGRPIWLVTTNNNIEALAFYQRAGFRLRALRCGAVDESRRTVKPQIPLTGANGLPIRDELELEWEPAAR